MLLVMLTLLLTLTISQTCRSQTTTIPNQKLRDAAKLIELGKIDRELVKAYKVQVEFLNQRIAAKDSTIANYIAADTVGARILQSYKDEVENLKAQRDIAVKAMNQQNKRLRRHKRKTVFVAIAGPAVTAAAFIYLKK